MKVMDAITGRRSIRNFSHVEVEQEKLNLVLEAARLAPSAANGQIWKFIIVKDSATRGKIAAASGGQNFIKEAPVIIIACAEENSIVMLCGQYRYTVDLSIAMSFMILEAYEQGLGSCWIGHFKEDDVKRILGIPQDVRIVALTPLGYPAESPMQRPRKAQKEIVCYEKYHK
ncbi:MAG: nitroreductase family protein [Clostridiales bacterium]|nr:nitroreductase family protein [Clostridiales bacterium]